MQHVLHDPPPTWPRPSASAPLPSCRYVLQMMDACLRFASAVTSLTQGSAKVRAGRWPGAVVRGALQVRQRGRSASSAPSHASAPYGSVGRWINGLCRPHPATLSLVCAPLPRASPTRPLPARCPTPLRRGCGTARQRRTRHSSSASRCVRGHACKRARACGGQSRGAVPKPNDYVPPSLSDVL